jgi:hypothetical protein
MNLIPVRVHWEDAIVFHGWEHYDPYLHRPRQITTVGYLVEDSNSGLVIAASYDAAQGENGHWCQLTVIPRASVIEVVFLDA